MPPGSSEFLDGKLDSESERADMLKGDEYVKDTGGNQRVHKVINKEHSGAKLGGPAVGYLLVKCDDR